MTTRFMLRANLILLGLLLLGVVGSAFRRPPSPPPLSATQELLGKTLTLGDEFTSVEGNRESLPSGPLLVFMIDRAGLFTCQDYAMEYRVMRQRYPRLGFLFVFVPDSPETEARMREYARRYRITDVSTIPNQNRFASLRQYGNMVILLSEDRSVVYVDDRQGGRFSSRPISRIFPLLEALWGTSAGAGLT